jgi:predicted ATPase
MPVLEGIRIQNFKALKDVTIGKLWSLPKVAPLGPLVAVIGKNGVGKTSIFDAFGFLSDCLRKGVEEACESSGRGGFERLRSKGVVEPIRFELYFRESSTQRPITYELEIDQDENSHVFVAREILRQRRQSQSSGRPLRFLDLSKGEGEVWAGNYLEVGGAEDPHRQRVELNEPQLLGITTLGTFKDHPRIGAFRDFITGWHLSYFHPDAARRLPEAGAHKHLNISGDNLANVVQFMERGEGRKAFLKILGDIALRIPGLRKIDTEQMPNGQLVLRFHAEGFENPFYAQQMSDGTLKLFAYMLLLADPSPAPFLCIEEPENGLYHKVLEVLAQELRDHARASKHGTQVFVTTHQPTFVNALMPEEVWVLDKGTDGFSTIRRASSDPVVKNLVAEGLPLGSLWYSDYLEPRNADAP